MFKKFLILALALTLSACASLYTTSRDWKLPAGLGDYSLKANLSVGLLMRNVDISLNEKTILAGQSWFWEDTITMEGAVQGIPLAALCHVDDKRCDLTIAGFSGIKLKF